MLSPRDSDSWDYLRRARSSGPPVIPSLPTTHRTSGVLRVNRHRSRLDEPLALARLMLDQECGAERVTSK
jgi:hypothetical protein